jgi:hypothetical protein
MASVDWGADEMYLNNLVGFGLFGEAVRVSSSGFRFMVFPFYGYLQGVSLHIFYFIIFSL